MASGSVKWNSRHSSKERKYGEGENPYGFEEAYLDVRMGNYE